VRQIDDRLENPLVHDFPQFVQEQRKDNRNRKGKNQVIKSDQNRIFKNPQKLRVSEHPAELIESDPWAACKALENVVVLKRHDGP